MLERLFPDIWFPNVGQFLDRNLLLSHDLTRNGDSIHLGRKGIARYVSFIKLLVYKREKRESSRSVQEQAPAPPGSPKGAT